jgi:hypothetical protein
MAATTAVHSFHGAGPTSSDISSTEVRWKRADNDTVDALNPVPIPTSGTNYSWRKHTKLRIESAPANLIDNLRWFSSGNTLGTGITHYVVTDASYTQASSSDESALIIGGVDSTTYTSGSPLTVEAGEVCDSGDTFPLFAGTGGQQDYVVQQMAIESTASAGTSPARTFTYRYDES